MCVILCMLLLWQMCAPLCMPCPIGLPYFTLSLLWLAFTPFTCSCCLTPFLSLTRQCHCPIRSDCRISLCHSSDWHLRHSRVLAALRLFSLSQDNATAFAAALFAPALVITMIQTNKTPLLQRSVAEEYHMPKRFCNDDMVWIISKHRHASLRFVYVYQAKE